MSRHKLRRSRSACDIRDMRPLKRTDPTLAPISAKTSRLMSTTATGGFANSNNKPTRFGTANLSTTAVNNVAKRPTSGQAAKPSTGRTGATTQAASGKRPAAAASNNANTSGAGKPASKRIPPYDFKARYTNLLEKHTALKDKLEEKNELLSNLENIPELLEETQSDLITTKEELKNAQTLIECLQRQSKLQQEKLECITDNLGKTTEELDKLTKIHNVSF